MKKYSASTNAFYDEEVNNDIPADAVAITDETWNAMLFGQSQGQVIAAGKDGNPALVDRELTDEEKSVQAELRKRELRAVADSTIAPLQDAVDVEMATEEEISSLKAWKLYRVLLNRVDTSGDVADEAWPVVPD